MTDSTDDRSTDAPNVEPLPGDAALPDGERVAEYLKTYPDFLEHHPEVLEALTPPERRTGEDVADLQRYLIERLQNEVETLRGTARHLINTSRSNMTTQAQTHAACLAVLEAESPEAVVHAVSDALPGLLDVDVARLCVEATEATPGVLREAGCTLLPPGDIDLLLGDDETVRLQEHSDPAPGVFGEWADTARSDAMVRLRLGPDLPPGLLALGSHHVGMFHPDDAPDLLIFLARVITLHLRTWLRA